MVPHRSNTHEPQSIPHITRPLVIEHQQRFTIHNTSTHKTLYTTTSTQHGLCYNTYHRTFICCTNRPNPPLAQPFICLANTSRHPYPHTRTYRHHHRSLTHAHPTILFYWEHTNPRDTTPIHPHTHCCTITSTMSSNQIQNFNQSIQTQQRRQSL